MEKAGAIPWLPHDSRVSQNVVTTRLPHLWWLSPRGVWVIFPLFLEDGTVIGQVPTIAAVTGSFGMRTTLTPNFLSSFFPSFGYIDPIYAISWALRVTTTHETISFPITTAEGASHLSLLPSDQIDEIYPLKFLKRIKVLLPRGGTTRTVLSGVDQPVMMPS